MLILEREVVEEKPGDGQHDLRSRSCLVLDLPDGTRTEVWFVRKRNGRLKLLIKAPPAVHVRRGEHLIADAGGPTK